MGLLSKIFKKTNTVIDSYNTHEAPGAEVWVVSWDARWGEYSGNKERKAKAFLNREDAVIFNNSLIEAKKLLQYTENLNIKIKKQQ